MQAFLLFACPSCLLWLRQSGRKGLLARALHPRRYSCGSSVDIFLHNIRWVKQWYCTHQQFVLSPDNICLNASSTPVASSAEVSMKARLLFSAKSMASSVGTARRCLKSLYKHRYNHISTQSSSSEPSYCISKYLWQSCTAGVSYLISNQHDYNIRLGVVAQFLQPPLHILERHMLRNIINQQSPHRSPVYAHTYTIVYTMLLVYPGTTWYITSHHL